MSRVEKYKPGDLVWIPASVTLEVEEDGGTYFITDKPITALFLQQYKQYSSKILWKNQQWIVRNIAIYSLDEYNIDSKFCSSSFVF